jgi:surface-anchored protein
MNIVSLFTAVTLASAVPLAAQNVAYLTTGHTDLGIFLAPSGTNRLYLQANDDDHGQSYPPNRVVLVASEAARWELPPGTPFGNEGDPLWILPQTQEPGILFLGASTETLSPAAFTGALKFNLKGIALPGQPTNTVANYFVWQAGSFGNFDLFMNTTDGITAADAIPLPAGAHAHYNWGFTTSGLWHVTFQVSGRLAGQPSDIISTNITFAFHVLPLKPFEQWQSTNWLPATPVSIIGPGADPDGDGIVNLAEFTLSLNPTNASRAGLPTASIVQSGGQRYGALTYTRMKYATDVTCDVVGTTSLAAPDWQPLTIIHSVEDLGDREQTTLRDSIPVSARTTRFYQLQVRLK